MPNVVQRLKLELERLIKETGEICNQFNNQAYKILKNKYINNITENNKIIINGTMEEFIQNGETARDFLGKICGLLGFLEADVTKNLNYYSNFYFLSYIIENLNFPIDDCLEIIAFVIIKDLSNPAINSSQPMVAFNAEDFEALGITGNKIKRVLDILKYQDPKTGTIDLENVNEEDIKLFYKVANYKNDKQDFVNKEKIKAMQSFKKCFVDRGYEEEDIEIIINNLNFLGVKPSLLDKIKGHLYKTINKINKQETAKEQVSLNFEKETVIKKEKTLSKKEYFEVLEKISIMYDLKENVPTKLLDLNELIYLINLLYKAGFKDEEIKRVILNTYKAFKTKEKYYAIGLFNCFYEKLLFYSDRYPEIKESIEFIKSCLQEMMIANDEDYGLWKSMIIEEMNKYNDLLKQKYEYEMERGIWKACQKQ